jgi:hypothetical protein
MPEQEQFRIDIQRSPVEGVDPANSAGCRFWIRQQVAIRHLHAGGVRPRFVYLRDGWLEEVDLTKLLEVGREETLARAFVAIGQREGISRRFRVGEALVRDADGRMRRAVGALEHVPRLSGEAAGSGAKEGAVEGSWWLTYRFAGSERDGHGALHSDGWTDLEGDDVDGIPEGFREWLDVGRAELESMEQRERAEPAGAGPDVRVAIANLLRPLPEEPKLIAGVIGGIVRDELRAQGMTCLLVFAITGHTLERWEVRGNLPCTQDDFMRSIASRDEGIVAIGHVGLANFEINGQPRRGFFCEIERGGRRGRWLLPMLQEGDPLPQDTPGMEADLGALADDAEGWLGVAPKVSMDFSVLGFEHQIDPVGGTELPEA